MSEPTYKKVEVQGGLTFIRPSQLAEEGTTGVIVEGKYIESLPNNFDEKKSDYKILTLDGETVIINGCGSLDNQMKVVAPGTLVQIEYNGKGILEKGKMKGKPFHDFTVLVAE